MKSKTIREINVDNGIVLENDVFPRECLYNVLRCNMLSGYYNQFLVNEHILISYKTIDKKSYHMYFDVYESDMFDCEYTRGDNKNEN